MLAANQTLHLKDVKKAFCFDLEVLLFIIDLECLQQLNYIHSVKKEHSVLIDRF